MPAICLVLKRRDVLISSSFIFRQTIKCFMSFYYENKFYNKLMIYCMWGERGNRYLISSLVRRNTWKGVFFLNKFGELLVFGAASKFTYLFYYGIKCMPYVLINCSFLQELLYWWIWPIFTNKYYKNIINKDEVLFVSL